MPGSLVKRFQGQADWQQGILQGLTITAGGGLTPTGDFTKQWSNATDWNSGTHDGTAVNADGSLGIAGQSMLEGNNLGANGILQYGTGRNYNAQTLVVQRIRARGRLTSVTVQKVHAYYTLYAAWWQMSVYKADLTLLATLTGWESPPNTSAQAFTAPCNIDLTDDVYIAFAIRAPNADVEPSIEIWKGTDYPPGVTEPMKFRTYSGTGSWSNWIEKDGPAAVKYTVEAPGLGVKTWTSGPVTHSIVTPESSWVKVVCDLPPGTMAAFEVRSSVDGVTWGPWEKVAFTGGPIGQAIKAKVQVRLTLETTSRDSPPKVTGLWLSIGPRHRWDAPSIDVSTCGDSLLTVLGPSALRVVHPGLIPRDGAVLNFGLDITKTGPETQELKFLEVYDAAVLQMLDDPNASMRPPEVTDVICYVEDSEPLIVVTASLPEVPADKKVEVRISVPEGSNQSYAQSYAEAYLAVHGVEKRSLACRVPLCTRIGFGELVAIAYAPWGHSIADPWQAMVQEITHHPLASPPYTELKLGDYQPDDTEALVRLIAQGG